MCACPHYRKNGLKCEPTDIDPLYCCDACHRALGYVRRSHLRIDKDKYLKGQYWSGDCTGPKEPFLVHGYTYALLLVEFHTRLKSSHFGVEKSAEWIISLLKQWDEEHLSIWRYVHRKQPDFWSHLLADNLELKYPEVVRFLHSIGVRPHFT